MTERAGQMSFLNIRRKVFALSASDAVDEVVEMSALGGMVIDLDDRFAIAFAAGKELAILDNACFEIEFVGNLIGKILFDVRNLRVLHQAAGFKQQQRVTVVEDGDELVGCFALVLEIRFIDVTPAQTDDAFRQRRAQRPAGNGHFMNALIADVSVPEIPEPMPVVMDQVSMKGLLRRRPQPNIEVQVGGRFLDWFESDAPTGLAAVAFRDQQLAVLSAFDERLERRLAAGAALRAVLNDAIVFTGR